MRGAVLIELKNVAPAWRGGGGAGRRPALQLPERPAFLENNRAVA